MSDLLIIPHINIHNANALSSPYTIGFPAMSAWLGGVHALQRKLNKQFPDLIFPRMAVACHHLNLQTYKGQGDYVSSIISTSNPLTKTGSRPSFIEEARCHLNVSLIIEYEGLCDQLDAGDDRVDDAYFITVVRQQLQQLKLAGGDILSFAKPQCHNDETKQSFKTLLRQLMPSYLLIERRDLMRQAMKDQPDAITALLDYLTIKHRSEIITHELQDDEIIWTKSKKITGWIVPIAVGFQGISALGFAKNQRDTDTPHRFAESVITLGEFKMPYRFNNMDEILWEYHSDLENNLYLCQQHNTQ